jgi:hypothetical protein
MDASDQQLRLAPGSPVDWRFNALATRITVITPRVDREELLLGGVPHDE